MSQKLLSINKQGLSADFVWLDILEKLLKKKFNLKKQISIALVAPSVMQRLNKAYRQKNQVTDVLSFELDNPHILGEVILCLDKIKKQAKENKKSIKSELQLLTIHGILHLFSYDHTKSKLEEIRQGKKEQELLKALNK